MSPALHQAFATATAADKHRAALARPPRRRRSLVEALRRAVSPAPARRAKPLTRTCLSWGQPHG